MSMQLPPLSKWAASSRGITAAFAACVALLASASASHAQLKGDYPPGFTGLQNGTQAPPSIAVIIPVLAYSTDDIRDNNGHSLGVSPRITALLLGGGVSWVLPYKILDANIGGLFFAAPFAKNSIDGARINQSGSLGFSDMYLQPLELGWHTKRADYVAGYGMFFPTGRYEFGGSDNTGFGMFSQDFQAGTTVRLDNKREWTISTLATYEIHNDKKDSDIHVGDILTLEGGLGRSFYKKVKAPLPLTTTIGLVYAAQFKVTNDGGPILTPLLQGRRDRVYDLGGEANVFIPQTGTSVGLRILGEFEARNRTQGVTYMLTIAQGLKSLAKTPQK
jgi:hypothetical protein